MDNAKAILRKIEAYKYPLMILLLGVVLLLFPSQSKRSDTAVTVEKALEEVLADSFGVGRIRVLVSDSGAVVVCEGADNASVKLDILRAIGSYTGLGSDKITILKMSNMKGR